jgi:cell wall assembly regulator SMI1
MQDIWKRIEAQLQHLAPSVKEGLRPGASEALLRQIEEYIPITLPEEVKALYRIHDGQTGLLINQWYFLSLKKMCVAWLLQGTDYGIPVESPTQGAYYAGYWHAHWLPFMGNSMGPMYCIDLAPGPEGRMGQILFYKENRSREYPDPLSPGRSSIRVVASGIEEFFSNLANDLEAGIYTFDEETGMLWSQDMYSALSVLEIESYHSGHAGPIRTIYLDKIRAYQRDWRSKAPPVLEEPGWDELERDHPRWNIEPSFSDFTDDSIPF